MKPNIQHSFQQYYQNHIRISGSNALLIAVSGGIDSVVLAHLAKAANIDFHIAHCNFQLRGEESQRDEQFVQALATQLGVPFHVQRFDTETYAAANKLSIQVAARELRYTWLEETRIAHQLQALATAHHLQDNVETVIMNLCKGTGIAGLHGILPVVNRLVRPLLFATRDEIVAFAQAQQISFVEDSSNLTDKYTRNYIRHHVLPVLKEVHPEAIENFGHSIPRFQEAEVLYRQALEVHMKKLVEKRKNEWFIPVLKLLQATPLHTIVYEIIKQAGFGNAQVQQVIDLCKGETGKYIASQSHRIIRDRQWLVITPIENEESFHYIIEKGDNEIAGNFGRITIQTLPAVPVEIPTDASIALLDTKHLEFPLLLRKWKQGDYFYPLGMDKKKKVARFLIDQKLHIAAKEKVWVIESNKRVVWIVGMRIDNRFRVQNNSQHILQLTFQPA
ncbi:tRNA(Ile)-lysidine synthase [Chitinophaga skermanii]|uniref:tRNA(Ile)-lysidine synthase n=1 Tax=Chitinophaga skermanii TaxID=331697 RepID=A0A327QRM5_9BACT|nr:tRNA lysidine(34) synthetase TilS [Chitinophaga skermanii]RAJ07000.1 tRNA(Ile)-lysidine synthase [Chitinophaga skermanii]